jgi:hypothetical protein
MCVSRLEGAGAQEVALHVAESLNFRLIDEDIATRAALAAGVEREVVADVERGRSALVRLIEGFGAAGMGAGYLASTSSCEQGQPASGELRGLIRSVIEDIAGEGSAVILAHAGSLALAGRADALRVLVTASPQARARRLASALGIDQKQAARAIKQSDAGRADYIKRFYGIGAEAPTHYDLVVNTDRLAPERAARLIVVASGRAEASSRRPAAMPA